MSATGPAPKSVNLVGLDAAGVWTYFARALAGPGVELAADLSQFRTDTDDEYLRKFEIPGIRKAGDFRAAAVLDTQDRLLVYNASPEFPAEWVRQCARAAGSVADIRSDRVTDAELVNWLTSRKAGIPVARPFSLTSSWFPNKLVSNVVVSAKEGGCLSRIAHSFCVFLAFRC